MSFGVDEERAGRKWFFRIASLAAIFALIAAVGVLLRKGQTFPATLLLFASVVVAVLFAWSWTGSLFSLLHRATRYVEGAEGDHRHEWYAFRGKRVRVFLDETRHPWFALSEIAYILELEPDESTFRHYGSLEYATPASAGEKCLSESGLRRLIRYSAHPDAGALGLWLERDVLRLLRNRAERNLN